MINIKTNIAQFINTEMKRIKNATNTATLSTTNKLAQQGLTEARKTMREEYNIKLKDITTNSKGRRVTYYELAKVLSEPASIVGLEPGISLGKFGAKQRKEGVAVQVKKGGAPKVIKHAFGPKIPRLGKGVFTRQNPKDSTVSKRLPIFRLYGPGAAVMMNNRKVFARVKAFVRAKYAIILEQEMKYRLGK